MDMGVFGMIEGQNRKCAYVELHVQREDNEVIVKEEFLTNKRISVKFERGKTMILVAYMTARVSDEQMGSVIG